jgi:hypothetical protein
LLFVARQQALATVEPERSEAEIARLAQAIVSEMNLWALTGARDEGFPSSREQAVSFTFASVESSK